MILSRTAYHHPFRVVTVAVAVVVTVAEVALTVALEFATHWQATDQSHRRLIHPMTSIRPAYHHHPFRVVAAVVT